MRKTILILSWVALIIVLLMPLVYAEHPWPMINGNLHHTGLSPYDTSNITGAVKWTFEMEDGTESSPTIAEDGTIYFGSHDGYLYSLNSEGTLKWKFKPAEPIYNERWKHYSAIISSPVIAKDGTVYIIAPDDNLYAVKDGKEKWRFPFKWNAIDFWSSAAIGPDGTIYAGSARTELTDTGLIAGFYAIAPDGKEKWHYEIDAGVTTYPAIGNDGTIYVGGNIMKKTANSATTEGYVFAFNPDGTLKWRFKVQDWIESSPSIAEDGTIYSGSKEGRVYAINPKDGSKKWEFVTGDGISGTPAISKDGTLYVGSWDNNMYAINPDGTEKWKFAVDPGFESIGSSAIIGADGTIYFGSSRGSFYALNPDGIEKWRISDLGSVASAPAIGKDGTIYFGAWNKKFYAIGSGEVSLSKEALENPGDCHVKQLSREVIFDREAGNTCIEGNCDSYSTICQRKALDGSCYASIEVCVSKDCKRYRSYCNIIIKNTELATGFTTLFKQNYITKDGQKQFIKEMKAFLLPGQERSIAWQYEVDADNIGYCDYSDLANPICEPEEEKITWNFTTERKDGFEDRNGQPGERRDDLGPPKECFIDGKFIGEAKCRAMMEKTPEAQPQKTEPQETELQEKGTEKGFLQKVIDWFKSLFR